MILVQSVAVGLVFLACIYLIVLGIASLVLANHTRQFLDGFASSQRLHFIEMLIRFLYGGAFIIASSQMMFSKIYLIFGWILIVTTIVLSILPWRWHQQLAVKFVRPLTQKVWLFSFFSLPLGGVILFSLFG